MYWPLWALMEDKKGIHPTAEHIICLLQVSFYQENQHSGGKGGVQGNPDLNMEPDTPSQGVRQPGLPPRTLICMDFDPSYVQEPARGSRTK